MKFFLLSKCGEGAGLLYRLQEEGNQCCIKIKEKDYADVYDGLLEKREEPDNDAIILVDSSGMGDAADSYKKRGFKVFGGSSFADKLELNRDFGLRFMEEHGIEYPKTAKFKTLSHGIDYVSGQGDKKLVFKPSGNLPCKLTYCSETKDELITYLKFVESHYSKEIDSFIIQDFVEGPVLSTEFWMGPEGFIRPANHTVEAKKFMNGNLGPSTGCQGNLVWIAEDDEVTKCLEGIEDALKKESYCGPIDLNVIVNEKGIYGLEWTPRFGLDAMPSLLQQLGDVGKIFSDMMQGTVHEMNGSMPEFSGGIRLSIPPYPAEPKSVRALEKESPSHEVPVDDLCEYDENCYFYEVKCEDGQLVHSCGTGVIAVISSSGDNPDSVFETPEDILDKVRIPDKQYRTDLCEVLPDMYCEAVAALEQRE